MKYENGVYPLDLTEFPSYTSFVLEEFRSYLLPTSAEKNLPSGRKYESPVSQMRRSTQNRIYLLVLATSVCTLLILAGAVYGGLTRTGSSEGDVTLENSMPRLPRSLFMPLTMKNNSGSGIVPTPTPASTITPGPPPVPDAEWRQLQHDPQHSGRTSFSVPPDYEVAWVWIDEDHVVRDFVSAPGNSITDGLETGFAFSDAVANPIQPIVADNRVFFGTVKGAFYALNAATGDTLWKFVTGGPVLGTAAYDSGIVIFGSMDQSIYGLNARTGEEVWRVTTGAGTNASPVITDGIAYIGSRDGVMRAVDVVTGAIRWTYVTRHPGDDAFSGAPIVAPAAVNSDGDTLIFGAENMNVYGLSTTDGSERWSPVHVVGQSFLRTWPVIVGDKAFFYTVSSLKGAEEGSTGMEELLASLSPNPSWQEEKQAVLAYLAANPYQRILTVLDINTGREPYQVAMGRVSGNNWPPHMPAVANHNGLPLTYWRSKHSTMFVDSGSFGSAYCSDISYLNPESGDRQLIVLPEINLMSCPELDNGFQPTIGGNWMYLQSHFRGTKVINLIDGRSRGISVPIASRDGANWRGGTCDGCWGAQIVYYGNDGDDINDPSVDPLPPSEFRAPTGFTGIAIAQINGENRLFINEGNAHAVVSIRQK